VLCNQASFATKHFNFASYCNGASSFSRKPGSRGLQHTCCHQQLLGIQAPVAAALAAAGQQQLAAAQLLLAVLPLLLALPPAEHLQLDHPHPSPPHSAPAALLLVLALQQ
jgi:hypothetical protein